MTDLNTKDLLVRELRQHRAHHEQVGPEVAHCLVEAQRVLGGPLEALGALVCAGVLAALVEGRVGHVVPCAEQALHVGPEEAQVDVAGRLRGLDGDRALEGVLAAAEALDALPDSFAAGVSRLRLSHGALWELAGQREAAFPGRIHQRRRLQPASEAGARNAGALRGATFDATFRIGTNIKATVVSRPLYTLRNAAAAGWWPPPRRIN
ncbi:IS110 family transposase [Babesia caballi]|uniref:IS110 family transposase n=1 Tax=Babesia caballi TaxID=5871 RepID=A0AAV4LXD9_BABCB|nr:IS110 family transposase [Babesia caballi]